MRMYVAHFGALTDYCVHLAARTIMFLCASFKIKIQIEKYRVLLNNTTKIARYTTQILTRLKKFEYTTIR